MIRNARKRIGWTPQDLANRLGVTRSEVYGWESGSRIPTPKRAAQIALVLEIDEEELEIYLGRAPASMRRDPVGWARAYLQRKGGELIAAGQG